ncbi:MAG: hypothetical protein Q8P35_02390 [Candidatus Yanofskybacteria bacterium]|nr:hypothetical protein [Candidatus Yanofskybacteria bacterium]
MEKIAANLAGIHNVKSLNSTGRRSIPPSAKSAFLDLYMRQNERDRIEKEKIRLQKRKEQIDQNLTAINEGMAKLLKIAVAGNKQVGEVDSKSGNHTVLGY